MLRCLRSRAGPYIVMRTALLLLLIVPLLAACGYKGPLYLPKPKPEAQTTPAPPAEDTGKAKGGP